MRKSLICTILALALILPPLVASADERGGSAPEKLYDVVVTATKTAHSLKDVPVETVLITREDIERSNANTVAGLLNQIPGFNFSQQADLTGAMGYKNTVRGLNVEGRYMLVLVDGQRVFTGYHAGGMASAGFSHNVNVVPVSMIERIEVVKGPGSALYGSDAMVGVMNIITRQPTKEAKVKLGGGYTSYTVNGHDYVFNKPKETARAAYEAHFTISRPINDRIRGTFSFSHEGNDGVNPTCYDVNRNYVHGQLEMDVVESLTLRGGAEFTAWESENSDMQDKKSEEAPRFWAVADYAISPQHNLKLQSYYQKLNANFNDPSYGEQRADVSYSNVDMQYTGNIFESNLLTLGVEYLKERLDTNLVDTSSATTSIYLQDEWSLFNGSVVLVPGVRYDYNDVYGKEWNPKLSVIYKPLLGTRIRSSAGWSFKAPTAIETSAAPINHYVMWIVANPSLEPERAFTWQVGMEQDLLDQRLVLGATYYHSVVDNMITYVATGRLMDGLPVMTYQNVNEAKIQGVEVTANAALLDGLNLLLTYAYTDARDGNTNKRLVDTPEHAFGAQLDYANSKYRFGGTLFMSYTSDQVNRDLGMPGSSPRTEDYTTVGLKLWKDFLEYGRISLEANNIFGEPLRGSDTIYVDRSVIARISFEF